MNNQILVGEEQFVDEILRPAFSRIKKTKGCVDALAEHAYEVNEEVMALALELAADRAYAKNERTLMMAEDIEEALKIYRQLVDDDHILGDVLGQAKS